MKGVGSFEESDTRAIDIDQVGHKKMSAKSAGALKMWHRVFYLNARSPPIYTCTQVTESRDREGASERDLRHTMSRDFQEGETPFDEVD